MAVGSKLGDVSQRPPRARASIASLLLLAWGMPVVAAPMPNPVINYRQPLRIASPESLSPNLVQSSWTETRVVDFGPAGDGSEDDTRALQDAIDSVPPGGQLVFPQDGTFLISRPLVIGRSMTVVGRGARIRQESTEKPLFIVGASGVEIAGLELIGPGHLQAQSDSRAVTVIGSSAQEPLSGFVLRHSTIRSWGMYGLYLQYVEDFNLSHNRIADIHYAGISVRSSHRGVISYNKIRNVIGRPNAYGITLTRTETDSLITDPRTSDVVVEANRVVNVPFWEAYDTHGGERIAFRNNYAYRCYIGLNIGSADGLDDVPMFAPKSVEVTGNVLDSGNRTGAAHFGIAFVGALGVRGTPTQYATGVVRNNLVTGYGDASNANGGALYLRDTDGLQVRANAILEPSPTGISAYHDNQRLEIHDNVIVDPWTNDPSVQASAGIAVPDDYNSVTVQGNSFLRADKVASDVLSRAISVVSSAHNRVTVGLNWSNAETYLSGSNSPPPPHLPAAGSTSYDVGKSTWKLGPGHGHIWHTRSILVPGAQPGDLIRAFYSTTGAVAGIIVGTVPRAGKVSVWLFRWGGNPGSSIELTVQAWNEP